MAEKQPMVVVKKITIAGAAAHGGSWKVAFADFMTAMMAFFLVMWLTSQSDEVKQNVSDYFSTPSIIEYNFSNYGAELTLEKLFLDIMNEPLQFFEQFIKPVDRTPNIMAMGSKKILIHHMAELMGDLAQNVSVTEDGITFEIPDSVLFQPGTPAPTAQFIDVMDKVKGLTEGLEDSNVYINSGYRYLKSEDRYIKAAKNIAEARLDLLSNKVEVGLEHETVDIYGKTDIKLAPNAKKANKGVIKFNIKQKEVLSDGSKPRKLEAVFDKSDPSESVYNNFVNQLSNSKKSE